MYITYALQNPKCNRARMYVSMPATCNDYDRSAGYMIDWIDIYAVLAIFQPRNDGDFSKL